MRWNYFISQAIFYRWHEIVLFFGWHLELWLEPSNIAICLIFISLKYLNKNGSPIDLILNFSLFTNCLLRLVHGPTPYLEWTSINLKLIWTKDYIFEWTNTSLTQILYNLNFLDQLTDPIWIYLGLIHRTFFPCIRLFRFQFRNVIRWVGDLFNYNPQDKW